jgi:hypothetical protein
VTFGGEDVTSATEVNAAGAAGLDRTGVPTSETVEAETDESGIFVDQAPLVEFDVALDAPAFGASSACVVGVSSVDDSGFATNLLEGGASDCGATIDDSTIDNSGANSI